jgi:hypothetical protein
MGPTIEKLREEVREMSNALEDLATRLGEDGRPRDLPGFSEALDQWLMACKRLDRAENPSPTRDNPPPTRDPISGDRREQARCDSDIECRRIRDEVQLEVLTCFLGVTDAGLAHLSRLENLRSIKCELCSVTGKGLSVLDGHPSLTQLEVMCKPSELPSWTYMPALPALTSLGLRGMSLEPAAIAAIGRMDRLTSLSLSTAGILPHLRALPKLQSLSLGFPVDPDDLELLVELTDLRVLALPNTEMDNEVLARIARLQTLTYLKMGSSGALTEKGVEVLRSLPKLTTLSISNHQLTSDREHWLKSRLPQVELVLMPELSLDRCGFYYGQVQARRSIQRG